ncbi:MAG: single-stranded-DNA-specific exonuclease RecJ [bacterium]
MLPRFRWMSVPTDAAAAAALAARFDLVLPVAGVLGGRGYADPAAAEQFLNPRLLHLGDPLDFPGVACAARRIWQAIHSGERIVVFGDFDADGVTSTALLSETIRSLGGCVDAFLPDRITEGYGLTRVALERCLREHPAQLLVTVDCGVNSVDEIALAQGAGLDVIVTDHHAPSETLPAALALINPRLGATPGAEHLCGAGVAFKLAHALVKLGRQDGNAAAKAYDIRQWLDAVAVATVADVVPLTGENRILVSAGLTALTQRPRMGLKALKHRAGLAGQISSHHLGFVLAPRLNAAGRMRTGWPALRLLHATDWDAAMQLAVELESLNAERRGVEADLVGAANAQLVGAPPAGAVVVAGTGWHVGAIGIVAARLSEAWNLPAVVIALDPDGGGRGSVRGGRGDNAVVALTACATMLKGFGGHPRAAGLQLKPGALEAFRREFAAACASQRGPGEQRPELRVDGWLTPPDIGPGLWAALQRLEPFGEGHSRPRWGLRGLRLAARPSTVGSSGEHLRLSFHAGATTFRGVWFKMGKLSADVTQLGEKPLDVVFELHENTYGGQSTLELQVVDLRPAE